MNKATKDAIAEVDAVIATLTTFKRDLPELMRRNRHVVGGDGYPATSMSGASQPGAVSRPTESAALGRTEPDPVRRATRDAMRALDSIRSAAYRLDNARRFVFGDDVPTRPPCENCGSDAERLRDGRCDACYTFRRRNGVERPVTATG